MELAFHEVVGASVVATAALKSLSKKQTRQPKAILARVAVVRDLLKEHHSDQNAGFSANSVVSFVRSSKALDNREASVRDAGAELVAMCVRFYGDSAVRGCLRGLSKRALQKIEDAVASEGGSGGGSAGAASGRRVAPATSSPTKSEAAPVKRGGRGGGRKGGRGGGKRGTFEEGSERDRYGLPPAPPSF